MTRDEVEAKLKEGYLAGTIETGLYNTGLFYVVLDAINGVPTCTWFENALSLSDFVSE